MLRGWPDRIKDADIDDSDIPRLVQTFFKKATMTRPQAKKQLTIRLDEDVLHCSNVMARATRRASTEYWAWLEGLTRPHTSHVQEILLVSISQEQQPLLARQFQQGLTVVEDFHSSEDVEYL
jgi:hypothetical protein